MIIGQVEKRSWKVKVLNICIHLLLILGSATMVYPLLLMLSGSFKSNVDFQNFTLIPRYLHDDEELFRKYIFTKYNSRINEAFLTYKDPNGTIDNMKAPAKISEQRVKDYEEFLTYCKESKPHYWYCMGHAFESGVVASKLREFRSWLKEHPFYGEKNNGIEELNKILGRKTAYHSMLLPVEHFFDNKKSTVYDAGMQKIYLEFKKQQKDYLYSFNWKDVDGYFLNHLRRTFANDLTSLNKTLGTDYNSWSEIILDETVPANKMLAEGWCDYVKTTLNPAFITLDTKKTQDSWKKFLLKKYGNFAQLKKIYGKEVDWKSAKDIKAYATTPKSGSLRADWLQYLRGNTTMYNAWSDFVKNKYRTVANLNRAWGTKYKTFNDLPELRDAQQLKNKAVLNDLQALSKVVAKAQETEIPADAIKLVNLSAEYRNWLAKKYKNDVAKAREAYATGYKTFEDIKLDEIPPGEYNLAFTRDWNEFVKTLPPEEIGLLRQVTSEYRDIIAGYYTTNNKLDLKRISEAYDYEIKNANEILTFNEYPADTLRFNDQMRNDYVKVIKSGKLANSYRMAHPEKHTAAWHAFLKKKYGTIDKLNQAWHLELRSFNTASLPTYEFEFVQMLKNRSGLIKEYLKRNYLMVFDTLFLNGNAALNTVIYCFLAVLIQLLVNPLCAYGLSRYKPATTYKILLFLMLPMAFPAMVLGIPQFLLIKKLGLLNTFAALILPGMANGYSIFLLKGFFDSLPKELFESASIDGASEWCIFWNIAMTLSKPILSVIALGAFTAAYANFMMAFLLCQDKSMWTMMVYLYQLQQTSSQAVGFAALIIAAIPTLIVFIFCQNIIIRGIVVPTEK